MCEWCWDWYNNKGPSEGNNPTGVPSGSSRVERGGGYNSGAVILRVCDATWLISK